MPAPKGYSIVQIALHWGIALLILGQILFGEYMAEVWDTFESTGVARLGVMGWGHVIGGSVVLGLVAWRLILRYSRGVPAPAADETRRVQAAGRAGHLALYALMVATPVAGLLAWFGGMGWAAELHGYAEPAFIALVGLHVAATIWHQFWLKDGLIWRMLRPQA